MVLDDRSERALRELETRYRCSASEVVRRALIAERERALGVPEDKRRRRAKALKALIATMDGHDWRGELRRLKEEDEHG